MDQREKHEIIILNIECKMAFLQLAIFSFEKEKKKRNKLLIVPRSAIVQQASSKVQDIGHWQNGAGYVKSDLVECQKTSGGTFSTSRHTGVLPRKLESGMKVV